MLSALKGSGYSIEVHIIQEGGLWVFHHSMSITLDMSDLHLIGRDFFQIASELYE
jgi:IMP dehydrogenase/GMP reductase